MILSKVFVISSAMNVISYYSRFVLYPVISLCSTGLHFLVNYPTQSPIIFWLLCSNNFVIEPNT